MTASFKHDWGVRIMDFLCGMGVCAALIALLFYL